MNSCHPVEILVVASLVMALFMMLVATVGLLVQTWKDLRR